MAGRLLATVGRAAGAACRAGAGVGTGVGSGGGTVGSGVGGTGVGGSGVGGTGVGGTGVGGSEVAVTTTTWRVGARVGGAVGVSSSAAARPCTTGGRAVSRSGARTTGSRTAGCRTGAGSVTTDGREGRLGAVTGGRSG